ncbi:hypothetical protein [Providencia rettgeri]|uniref:hypothetical protein n=1 Tax=Providencia rettgeri TaxID=587 RepID=UPI0023AB365C|nr:hypothetical protein [Providencia rettgeri]
MAIDKNELARAISLLNEAIEESSNASNHSLYAIQPPEIQKQIMQNAYNSGLSVKEISTLTGAATSTVYSKINTTRK